MPIAAPSPSDPDGDHGDAFPAGADGRRHLAACRLDYDQRKRTRGEHHAGHRIRIDERAMQDDRRSERDDGPAEPGGPALASADTRLPRRARCRWRHTPHQTTTAR